MAIDIRDVYEKVRGGDSLTNAEILSGIDHFSRLRSDLSNLGPVFLLSANEANRVLLLLIQFAQARGIWD